MTEAEPSLIPTAERPDAVAVDGSAVVGGSIHCLTIVGQIEGHQALSSQTKTTRYEHILPLLASIEESPDIAGLLILLNTAGGDVEAGPSPRSPWCWGAATPSGYPWRWRRNNASSHRRPP